MRDILPGLRRFFPWVLLLAACVIRLDHVDQFGALFDENLTQSVVNRILAGDLRNNWKFADVPTVYKIDLYNFSSYFYLDAAFVKLAATVTDGQPDHPMHWHRAFSVLAGTFAAFLFYLLARRWFDELTALVCLAFLAVAPILVQDAHYARPEAVEILLVGILYLLCDQLRDKQFRYSVMAAASACAGFLGAMKFSLLPMVVVVLFWVPEDFWKDRRKAARVAITAVGSLIAGMFAGVPNAFFRPAAYWRGVQFLRIQYGGVHRPHGNVSERYTLNLELTYFWQTLGPVLLLLAIVAAVVTYRTLPKRIWRSLCIPTAFYFAVFSLQRTFFERNLSHVVPLLLMLSAAGLVYVLRYVRARARLTWIAPAVAVLLFVAAVVPPALVCKQLLFAMTTTTEDRARGYERDLLKRFTLPLDRTGRLVAEEDMKALIRLAGDDSEGALVRVDDYNDPFTEHYVQKMGRFVQMQQVGFFPSVFENLAISTLHYYHSQAFRYLLLKPLSDGKAPGQEVWDVGGWKFRRFGSIGREIDPGPVEMNSWVENGYYPDVGRPRIGGRCFGTWTMEKGDANTGDLHIGPTAVVENPTLLIPIVTGPSNEGLSIVVKDHTSGAELARMNPPVMEKWKLWQVDLPKEHKGALDIVASDHGAGLGQWMAIGVPRTHSEFMEFGDLLATPGGANIQGAWTRDGYFRLLGKPAINGVVYGSWSGKDSNTGILRMKATCSRQEIGIGIPLVTGPNTDGLSVKLINTKTGKAIASLDPPPVHTDWWAWKVNVPLDRNATIEIVAEDRGTGFGQWLAIGQPHELR